LPSNQTKFEYQIHIDTIHPPSATEYIQYWIKKEIRSFYRGSFSSPLQVLYGRYSYNNHTEACLQACLQESLSYIQRWLKEWRIKATGTKSVHVIFTTRKETCAPVTLNSLRLSQVKDAKYLGLHLDRRLIGENICSSSENNLDFNWEKYTGYSAANRNCQLKTSCYHTRQFGPIAFNCGAQFPIQIWKYSKTNTLELSMLHGTSPMTYYIMILTCHTLQMR